MSFARRSRIAAVILSLTFIGVPCWAADAPARSILIEGRKEATVTTGDVRLSDLAQISSKELRDDEAVIGLKRLVIGQSPLPGKSAIVTADQVLSSLKSQGVNLDQVGYMLPREIRVARAGRGVLEMEVRSAIESFLGVTGDKMSVKSVSYAESAQIYPGEVTMKAVPLTRTNPSHMDFNIVIGAEGEKDLTLKASAAVEEWREVPIASRTLPKGSTVGVDDYNMARLNMAALPKDAAVDAQTVIGLKVNEDVGAGEVFRRNKLAVPAVIAAGERVTLRYSQGRLEASATGTSLESAAQGQMVRVRNENSKKVVVGTAREPGIVEVRP